MKLVELYDYCTSQMEAHETHFKKDGNMYHKGCYITYKEMLAFLEVME